MRRLLPWLLLGLLGIATGLGVGLGLANSPNTTTTSSTAVVVPRWTPPRNVPGGVVGVTHDCTAFFAGSHGPTKPPVRFIEYGQATCKLRAPFSLAADGIFRVSFTMDIAGHHLSVIRLGGEGWVTWQEGREYFVVWSQQVSLSHVLRFTGGLKPAS